MASMPTLIRATHSSRHSSISSNQFSILPTLRLHLLMESTMIIIQVTTIHYFITIMDSKSSASVKTGSTL